MSLARGVAPTFELPEGFRLVPIESASEGQPLRICVAVATSAAKTSPAGPWVLLRSSVDARVYLGAVVDAGGRAREWLELWVQTISNIGETLATNRDHFSNRVLDLRWRQVAKSLITADSDGFIETGYEDKHPRPVYIDLDSGKPWHPIDPETDKPWTVATDDAELLAAGLPPFGSSLHRYWKSGDAGAVKFVAVTPGAPTSAATVALNAVLPADRKLAGFNPEGGLLIVRRRAPFSLDEYADFLSGRPWKGFKSGRESFALHPAFKALSDWDQMQQGGAHLFGSAAGRAGRFLETFHLKLSALHQAVRLVRAAAQSRQLPFLNLSAESFRVTLQAPGSALPALWTAQLTPTLAGQAVALPIKTAEVRYFMALEQPAASVYRPAFLGMPIRGRGTARIRRVFADTGERTCLEGTLVTNDRVGHSASDILWLRLPLLDRMVDLFARLDTEEGLARGEARFRTIPQDLEKPVDAALRGTEGSVFPDTEFETIPLLSSPADLYSLGVLGALLLTVNSGNTLGVAVDEMISFARKLGQEARPDETLAARAVRIAEADRRWVTSLGAQRLAHEAMTADEAFSWMPAELWWSVLATLARFFPGLGPDSYCKDFGDVSPFNLEKVFDRPLGDLDNLLVRSRGLLLSDWVSNRELARVLKKAR